MTFTELLGEHMRERGVEDLEVLTERVMEVPAVDEPPLDRDALERRSDG